MAIDKKRLVFCFDGTWNRLDAPNPTNVVLTAESVLPLGDDEIAQVIYYDEGVGTAKGESLTGGVFGEGVDQNLADAYRHLIFNHTPGDDIFVFGFSRGAFTARSFVGLIRNCGIVARCHAAMVNEAIALYRSRAPEDQPSRETARRFRADFAPDTCVEPEEEAWRRANVKDYAPDSARLLSIAYLGVWDTVGALGVPKRYRTIASFFNRSKGFHDTGLSAILRAARHAVAIDESRLDFEPTLWTGGDELNAKANKKPDEADAPFQQKWFPGVHGSVGGGGDFHGLSDQALDWIWDGARMAGLRLDSSPSSRIYRLLPDFTEPLDNTDLSKVGGFARFKAGLTDKIWRRGPRSGGPVNLHHVSVSARRRWHASGLADGEYRPPLLAGVAGALGADLEYAKPFPLPAPDTFDIVVVEKGQSLSRIAKDLYGNAMRWPEIFAMNRDKLWDENRIYTGMSLRVPLK